MVGKGITNSTVVILDPCPHATAPETPRPPEIREEANKTITIKLFPTSTKYGPIRQVNPTHTVHSNYLNLRLYTEKSVSLTVLMRFGSTL